MVKCCETCKYSVDYGESVEYIRCEKNLKCKKDVRKIELCDDWECEHKLIYLETSKYSSSRGYHTEWTRIDRFYCKRCGEIIVKKKTECHRNRPDWY